MAQLDQQITIRLPKPLALALERAAKYRFLALRGEGMTKPEISQYLRWLIGQDLARAAREINGRRPS